ncbi:MAG: patatin-like phospholipase family protein [Gemmatimonadales bacterium]
MGYCTCTTGGEPGIALSGARALAQLGVLKELDRAGIPVSYVTGTSAGAVIGAVYVTSNGDERPRVAALSRSTPSWIRQAAYGGS